jgi:hypothetical protein
VERSRTDLKNLVRPIGVLLVERPAVFHPEKVGIFGNTDYASKFCRSAIDNVTGLPIGDVTSSFLLGDSAPYSEDCALASKSAAAFAALNVSAVPLAIRSSRLLPAFALRLTSPCWYTVLREHQQH